MKTVVVLSPPRSGSSLLAGVLHRLGVRMGSERDLGWGVFLNDYGCYEDLGFLRLNSRILINAGSVLLWSGLLDNEVLEPVVLGFEESIRGFLSDKQGVWGWKVPSTLYTIPFFHDLLDNPLYICLRRRVGSVVKSVMNSRSSSSILHALRFVSKLSLGDAFQLFKNFFHQVRRDGLFFWRDESLVKRVVERSYERISDFVKGKKSLSVDFNDLVNDSRSVINRLVDFIGIKPSKKQLDEALSFVHPELVHF